MPYLEHAGAQLFHTDEGSGSAVLLLHGWSCDSHDWSWQIPVLLAAGHRVIALDQRGHGRSSAPQGAYGPQVLADDAAALLDELGTAPAVVIGHSMGTVVASALAVRHPAAVRALVLVDPVYSAPDDVLGPALAAVQGPAPNAVAAAMFEQAFYTDATPPFLRTWHRRRLLSTPGHVVAGCLLGLYSGPEGLGRAAVAAEYLRRRTQPRLTLHASEQAATFERALPTGPLDRVEVLVGAGHFLHQERPDETNALMLGWIEGLRDPAAAAS